MLHQKTFFGVIDEDIAIGKNHQQRFVMLETAMENIGLAPHVAKWKIARLIHLVAGSKEGRESDGVLCRSAKDIATDSQVKCGYKTALNSIQWLIDCGLVEVDREETPACRGGRPYRCLKINWQFVARHQNREQMRVEQLEIELEKQLVIEPEMQLEIELETQLVIQDSLYSSLSPTPPPPMPESEATDVAAAVELLRSVLSDEETIQHLAVTYTDRIETVVAEWHLNSEHLGPGALAYRLRSPVDAWPTEKATRTLESEQRAIECQIAKRRHIEAMEAQDQAARREAAELEALRQRHGPKIDSMSRAEYLDFGLRVLPESDHKAFRDWPRVFEPEILKAMEMEFAG